MTAARNRHRLPGFEHLEAREVPAAALLADLNTSAASSFDFPFGLYSGSPAAGAAVNGVALFSPADGVNPASLWKSDGTAAGTRLVTALPTAAGGLGSPWGRPDQFTPAGNKAFFTYDDGSGQAVWVTDGTAAGTREAVDPAALANAPYATIVGAIGGKALVAIPVPGGFTPFPSQRLYATDGTAAGTTLVKDLGWISNPVFAVVGGSVYFGTEAHPGGQTVTTVWKSDGTAAGTAALAALPGGVTLGAGPGFAVAGDTLYFAAYDPDHGQELWAYQPDTGAGLVLDINERALPALPIGFPQPTGNAGSNPWQLTAVGDTLYFVADDGEHGQELWATDGTAGGTGLVADLSPPVGSPDPTPYPNYGPSGSRVADLRVVGGRLVFTATPGDGRPQLYTSDGTEAGTVPLTDLPYPTSPDRDATLYPYSGPKVVGAAGGRLVFSVHDTADGPQLGTTDGTPAGTALLPRSAGGVASGLWSPWAVGAVGGSLLFHADNGAGRQLYRTDGTAAGTSQVARINPGTAGSWPAGFVTTGTVAVFAAYPGGYGGAAVYATDGTAAPALVRAFDQAVPVVPDGSTTVVEQPAQLTAAGGKVYFVGQVAAVGWRLYRTDGTAAGTTVVKEVELPADLLGQLAGFRAGIDNLTPAPGVGLYFTLDLPGTGQQLWKTDGTPAGTKLVATVSPRSVRDPGFELPRVWMGQLTAVGNTLYFAAGDEATGAELWKSDGTAAGTRRVKDIVPGAGGSSPSDLVAFNGKLFFTATRPDGTTDRTLWQSDGTAGGTTEVAAAGSAGWYDQGARGLVPAGGKLYFAAREAGSNQQLYVTDGTAAGTKKVITLNPPGPGNPVTIDPFVHNLTAVGSKVYFVARDAVAGWQLYTSDGTAAGTKVVKPIGKGLTDGTGQIPVPLLVVGDRLLFTADDAEHGGELWATDGTAAGTRLVQDIAPGFKSGGPGGTMFGGRPAAAAVNGRVVFAADDGRTGTEPWSVPVAEVAPPLAPPVAKSTLIRASAVATAVGVAGPHALATLSLPAGPTYNVWVLWGDGKTTAGTLARAADGTFALSGSHAYAAAGTYAITARVMADGRNALEFGTTATVTAGPITIPVVPPVVPPPAAGRPTLVTATPVAATAGQAGPHALATVTLPAGPTYNVWVLWGDGRTTAGTLTRTTGTTYAVAGSHAYAAAGTYAVTVRVMGNYKNVLEFGTTATVAARAGTPPVVTPPAPRPTLVKVSAVTAAEGVRGVFTLAAVDLPAGPRYTATIKWGDGTTTTGDLTRTTAGGTVFAVTGSHAYADPGTYPVEVQVSAGGRAVLTAATTATVADSRFYVGRVAGRSAVGVRFAGAVATIRDTNPLGGKATDFTATIDWGDGTTTAGRVQRTAAGRFEVVGEHTFTAVARRTVTVTVRSTGGTTARAESPFTIDAYRTARR